MIVSAVGFVELLLGADIGTEGCKVILVTRDGLCMNSVYHSYQYETIRPGWTEQDPSVWWDAFVQCVRQLWQEGARPEDISGIGISGQMHSPVLLDGRGQVIRRSILWNDLRSASISMDLMHSSRAEHYVHVTANAMFPGFTAPTLLWIQRHEKDMFSRVRHVMMAKDFVRYRLTGLIATDVSDASGTGFLDVHYRNWSQQLIFELGFRTELFPEIMESAAIAGHVTSEAALETSLLCGIPVITGAGDNAASAVGTGTVDEGNGMITIGTSGAVIASLDSPRQVGTMAGLVPLHVFAHAMPNKWFLAACSMAAGACLRWLRDMLESDASYDDLIKRACSIPPGSDGLTFLPYLAGNRDYSRLAPLRAAFIGLQLLHTQGHMVRAVIEGVAFCMKNCLETLHSATGIPLKSLVLTGGIVNSDDWTQLLCDVLQAPIDVPDRFQGAAYGSAVLTGMALGWWSDTRKLFSNSFSASKKLPVEHQGYKMAYAEYLRQSGYARITATPAEMKLFN